MLTYAIGRELLKKRGARHEGAAAETAATAAAAATADVEGEGPGGHRIQTGRLSSKRLFNDCLAASPNSSKSYLQLDTTLQVRRRRHASPFCGCLSASD